ncbi:dihydroorotate oxidase A [Synechococcus sp. PCC 7502]|uniref:quinone-dependent dihydroorotate dehydrogenase n=1 Tax=Synechococcus sp. PCC 7502 TaxID=1173263 RepID=UPI00029FBCA8|nr:quinone-dependent dihydroorotate dehydrogenase [Synechococcus sp. PCC 7502]AFY74630.1 dihydroorotate oxidase A [Synechococcus sp. PCC 7502]
MLSQISQTTYRAVLRPLLFALDPELAHSLAIATVQTVGNSSPLQSVVSRFLKYENPRLSQNIMGINFANPIGLAAGFDKNAIAIGGWSSFGFGFAEVGSITWHGQSGNPQPRLFRLPKDEAIINRMGFNNIGAEAVAEFLKTYYQQYKPSIPIGINLGKSKITPLSEAKNDYVASFKLLKDFGDYFVVNVSSPNTVGLRDLQAVDTLQEIIQTLQAENFEHKPLLVKIAPDLNDEDIQAVVQMSMQNQVAGIIATNTTIARQNLQSPESLTKEIGGLSGQPVKKRSLEVIKLINQISQGSITIIGVGGIASAQNAWDKITAGASLVQLYTGLVYEGLPIVKQISAGLVQKLDQFGLSHISEAVGKTFA